MSRLPTLTRRICPSGTSADAEDRDLDALGRLLDHAQELLAILDLFEDEQAAPALLDAGELIAEERDARTHDLGVLARVTGARAARAVDVAGLGEYLELGFEDLIHELGLGVELVAQSVHERSHILLEIVDRCAVFEHATHAPSSPSRPVRAGT